MKDELYKKVYIKTKNDLPKDDGMYFINIKGKEIGLNACRFETKLDIDNWMSNIDWYLLPTRQESKDEEYEITPLTENDFKKWKQESG